MKKNILIITIGLVIIGIIIFLSITSKNNISSQNIKSQGIAKVDDVKMYFPILSLDKKNILFYDIETSTFSSYDLENRKKEKISSRISPPKNVYWSPGRKKMIISIVYNLRNLYSDNFYRRNDGTQDNQEVFYLFDLEESKIYPLNKNIYNVSWMYNSEKIIYSYYDRENGAHTLNISNPDGSDWKIVKNFKENIEYSETSISQIETPDDKNVYYISLIAMEATAIFQINLENKSIRQMIPANEIITKKNSQKIIYTVNKKTDPFGANFLGIFNLNDNTTNIFDIITQKENIFWNENSKYAFVLGNDENSSNFKLYSIDIDNNKINKNINLNINKGNVEKSKVLIVNNNTLYLMVNDLLYKLDLP